MTLALDRSFDSLKVGERASFEHIVSEKDIDAFVRLSGDENPLHTDASYASKTQFKERIVHGMLLGAYISRLIGMYLPGRRALLMKETLEFKEGVRANSSLEISGTIVQKSESTKIVEIALSISTRKKNVCSGTAHVRVLD